MTRRRGSAGRPWTDDRARCVAGLPGRPAPAPPCRPRPAPRPPARDSPHAPPTADARGDAGAAASGLRPAVRCEAVWHRRARAGRLAQTRAARSSAASPRCSPCRQSPFSAGSLDPVSGPPSGAGQLPECLLTAASTVLLAGLRALAALGQGGGGRTASGWALIGGPFILAGEVTASAAVMRFPPVCAEPAGTGEDWLVKHPAFAWLADRDGRHVTRLGSCTDAGTVARQIAASVAGASPSDPPLARRGSCRYMAGHAGALRHCARSSMDRAPDYGSGGWRFESFRARQHGPRLRFPRRSAREAGGRRHGGEHERHAASPRPNAVVPFDPHPFCPIPPEQYRLLRNAWGRSCRSGRKITTPTPGGDKKRLPHHPALADAAVIHAPASQIAARRPLAEATGHGIGTLMPRWTAPVIRKGG